MLHFTHRADKHHLISFVAFAMRSVAVRRPGREPCVIQRLIRRRALGPQRQIFHWGALAPARPNIHLFLLASDWDQVLAMSPVFFLGCMFVAVVEDPPLH